MDRAGRAAVPAGDAELARVAVEAAKQRLQREAAAQAAREAMRRGVIEGGKAAAEQGAKLAAQEGAEVVVEGAAARLVPAVGIVFAAIDVGRIGYHAWKTNEAADELEASTDASLRQQNRLAIYRKELEQQKRLDAQASDPTAAAKAKAASKEKGEGKKDADEGSEESSADQASAKKETGSYTVTFGSGKRYHGKGPKTRADDSAERVGEEHDDPADKVEWKAEPNQDEAFKAEARRIRADSGVKNPDNYNKINSPGEKKLQAEEKASSQANKQEEEKHEQ